MEQARSEKEKSLNITDWNNNPTTPQSTTERLEFAVLDPPSEMPPAVIQRMKDLKCPPPVMPSKINPRINELNNSISRQADEIEMLEKMIEDLEKRYRVSFSCDNNPKYDLQSGDVPQMYIGGNLTNIELKFRLWSAEAGIIGNRGVQGDQGNAGPNSISGDIGVDGYYGIRGNKNNILN